MSEKNKKVIVAMNQRNSIHRVQPDPETGLTREQAAYYKENGWDNRPVSSVTISVKEIFRSNICTWFNLIFLVLFLMLLTTGSITSMTFVPVILLNILVGIIQELLARRKLLMLSRLHRTQAQVLRNGLKQTIPSEDLVLDDIVCLTDGKQIAADGVLLSGCVLVNESLLTGESNEVQKNPGDTLLSGSAVVSGTCQYRITSIGTDSYLSSLELQAAGKKKREASEILRFLKRIVFLVGLLLVPLGAAMLYETIAVQGNSIPVGVRSMVAALIGMIPEGLYLLTTVTLAVGVLRLSSKKVLVHEMKSIESLSRITCLCLDKTGTITSPDMAYDHMEILDPAYEGNDGKDRLNSLLADVVKDLDAGNHTIRALKEAFPQKSRRKILFHTPFSSEYKFSGITFTDESYVLGAPEILLADSKESYENLWKDEVSSGQRALLLARCDTPQKGGAFTGELYPIAILYLINPIRPEAPEIFEMLKDSGISLKVISGDHAMTASYAAAQAGIEQADRAIDCTEMTEKELEKAAGEYTVFGRATPEQKALLVKTFQKKKEKVAMCGDGVNDILAMKQADCSLALASGSEAAALCAEIVLLDSDFSRMPVIVAEGRRIVNNLQRAASLFLVKNISSLLLAIFTVVFGFLYPMTPSQMTLVSVFTIGIPGFFLAMMPNEKKIHGHFASNVMIWAIPAGLTSFAGVAAFTWFSSLFGLGTEETAAAATILSAVTGFLILYHTCRPFALSRMTIAALSVFGFAVCAILFRKLFGLMTFSLKGIILAVAFSCVEDVILRLFLFLAEFLSGKTDGED